MNELQFCVPSNFADLADAGGVRDAAEALCVPPRSRKKQTIIFAAVQRKRERVNSAGYEVRRDLDDGKPVEVHAGANTACCA